MIIVMRKQKSSVRAAAKDATHERIVSVASRAIRRSGYGGTGVADIMKEAGLTHGGFYSHFLSREAMLAEAAARACAESAAAAAEVVATTPPDQALASLLGAYLQRSTSSGSTWDALLLRWVRKRPAKFPKCGGWRPGTSRK